MRNNVVQDMHNDIPKEMRSILVLRCILVSRDQTLDLPL